MVCKMRNAFDNLEDLPLREADDVPTNADLDLSKTDLEMLLVRGGLSKTFHNKGEAVQTLKLNWENIVKATPTSCNDDTEKEKPKSELIREYFQLVGKDGSSSIQHYEPISKGSNDHQPDPVTYKTGTSKGESRLFPVTSKDVSIYDLKVAIAALKSDAASSSAAKAD